MPPPTKRVKHNYDLTKTFEVLVGKAPNQKRFTVHHDLIVQRSEFFRAASSSCSTETDELTTLEDHEPEVFSAYLHSSEHDDTKEGAPVSRKRKIATAILFVGNLNHIIQKNQLAWLFSRYGSLQDYCVVEKCRGRNGHLKTFGFVGFTDDNNAEKAMENFHGFEFDGRHIRVEFVRPHSEIIQTFRQKQDSPTAHSTAVLGVESDNDDGSDDSSGDDDDTGDDSQHTDNGIPQKSFDVLVGKEPNQQRFTVYHDLLTQRSDFFRAARSEHWVTKPNQPTTLDDHEPATFSLYLHCVNFGAEALEEHIDAMAATSSSGSDSNSDSDSDSGSPSESDGDRKNDRGEGDAEDDDTEGKSNINNTGGDGSSECDSSNSGDAESRWLGHAGKRLVDLYLLADKLLDPTTANTAIDKWIRMAEAKDMYASYNMISYVYSSTTAGSPLRRLIRDWYVYTVEKTWAEDLRCCDFPHEFLQDIILEMYAHQRENGEEDICDCF